MVATALAATALALAAVLVLVALVGGTGGFTKLQP